MSITSEQFGMAIVVIDSKIFVAIVTGTFAELHFSIISICICVNYFK